MAEEVWVDVRVANPRDPRRSFKVKALVDNGSTDSAMPAKLLRRIGVRPRGRERYEAWAGKVHWRRWGEAEFRIEGKLGTVRITFEPLAEIPTIGSVALETLGFDIDMKNGGLRPFKRRGPHIRRRPHHALV